MSRLQNEMLLKMKVKVKASLCQKYYLHKLGLSHVSFRAEDQFSQTCRKFAQKFLFFKDIQEKYGLEPTAGIKAYLKRCQSKYQLACII